MKTYQITVTDEFAAFIDRMIAERKWDTVDDLVMSGLLTTWGQVDTDADMTPGEVARLRTEIQIGIDQADRGEVVPLDLDAIWERARARHAAMREASHAGNGTHRPG